MAYNEALAQRIRQILSGMQVEEKKMFGSLAFLVCGKMCVAAGKNRIMCRVDPAEHDHLLERGDCRTVVMRGRKYMGYLHVDEKFLREENDLNFWISRAVDFNQKINKKDS